MANITEEQKEETKKIVNKCIDIIRGAGEDIKVGYYAVAHLVAHIAKAVTRTDGTIELEHQIKFLNYINEDAISILVKLHNIEKAN